MKACSLIALAATAGMTLASPMPVFAAAHDRAAALAQTMPGRPQADAVGTVNQSASQAWDHVLPTDNALRDSAGLPFNGIKDIDLAETRRDAAFATAQLIALRAISAAQLDPETELTRQFLIKFYEDLANGPVNWIYDFAITPYSGVLPVSGLIEFASKQSHAQSSDRETFRRLLAEFGDRLAQMRAKTLAQAEAGIYLPRPAIGSLRAIYQALAGSAEKRLVPAEAQLTSLPPADRAAYAAEVGVLIRQHIAAPLAAIADVLDAQYEAKAPATIGLAQYPGGKERYQRAIATYTTMAMSPEALHALGLRLTGGAQERLAAIRADLGFTASQAEFHLMLNTDPKFRVIDTDALEALYRAQIVRIEARVPDYFSRLPKAGYAIRRIPASSEGGVAFGYYERPTSAEPLGLFRYNGANLEKRSIVQAAAINFHELIPGHHFHLALQAENDRLPIIRRELASLRLSAYNEGWAQYAAGLAIEMGALTDRHELYGLVATDAMMAARLVVDTGVNALGWDLDRACEYLTANTLMSPEQARAEVLRYATDVPGQALAYKLGHEQITQLRRTAEARLGPMFDIRAFHDAILAPGALPLNVLEWHVERWIALQEETKP